VAAWSTARSAVAIRNVVCVFESELDARVPHIQDGQDGVVAKVYRFSAPQIDEHDRILHERSVIPIFVVKQTQCQESAWRPRVLQTRLSKKGLQLLQKLE
jgi:hypothetical protein